MSQVRSMSPAVMIAGTLKLNCPDSIEGGATLLRLDFERQSDYLIPGHTVPEQSTSGWDDESPSNRYTDGYAAIEELYCACSFVAELNS
jgi:hypothetical protein